jgi:hypothetical protein
MEYSPAPTSNPQQTFSFGASTANVPFLFNIPEIPASPQSEIVDIHMADPSPVRTEEAAQQRPIALGGVRRVRRQREKAMAKVSRANPEEDSDESSSEDDPSSPIRKKRSKPWTTSNHYTLNMPSPAPPPTNLPFLLVGYVTLSNVMVVSNFPADLRSSHSMHRL